MRRADSLLPRSSVDVVHEAAPHGERAPAGTDLGLACDFDDLKGSAERVPFEHVKQWSKTAHARGAC
jgi:hypothetical protein